HHDLAPGLRQRRAERGGGRGLADAAFARRDYQDLGHPCVILSLAKSSMPESPRTTAVSRSALVWDFIAEVMRARRHLMRAANRNSCPGNGGKRQRAYAMKAPADLHGTECGSLTRPDPSRCIQAARARAISIAVCTASSSLSRYCAVASFPSL